MNMDFESRHKLVESSFYSEYKILSMLTLQPGQKKQFVGDKKNRICRYCDKGEGQVTFRKVAHAIPVLIGNKILFDYSECDNCNGFFGRTIEDSFANYFHPHRTMNRIIGRKKPGYKTKEIMVEIDSNRDLNIKIPYVEGGDSVYTRVANDLIRFDLSRRPYHPIAVYKMFVKIALALMPKEEDGLFKATKEWLVSPAQHAHMVDHKVIQFRIPGPSDPDIIRCALCKANDGLEDKVVKFVLIFAFSNLQFQIPIPSAGNESPRIGMPLAPSLRPITEFIGFGEPFVDVLDFTSNERVKGEKTEIYFRVEKEFSSGEINE